MAKSEHCNRTHDPDDDRHRHEAPTALLHAPRDEYPLHIVVVPDMGGAVGDGVGTGVGILVGDGVGVLVGDGVGTAVGVLVGDGVGTAVGVLVGDGVGDVGALVGSGVGALVGGFVGTFVGPSGGLGPALPMHWSVSTLATRLVMAATESGPNSLQPSQ